jgi:hypothetical protein
MYTDMCSFLAAHYMVQELMVPFVPPLTWCPWLRGQNGPSSPCTVKLTLRCVVSLGSAIGAHLLRPVSRRPPLRIWMLIRLKRTRSHTEPSFIVNCRMHGGRIGGWARALRLSLHLPGVPTMARRRWMHKWIPVSNATINRSAVNRIDSYVSLNGFI